MSGLSGAHDAVTFPSSSVNSPWYHFPQEQSLPHLGNRTRSSSGHVIEQDAIPIFPVIKQFLAHPGITPMMPESLQRYSNRPKLGSNSVKSDMTVEMWTYQQIKPRPPHGWQEIVHPEGGRYFFCEAKRAYTDADLYNPDHLREAMTVLAVIENFLTKHAIRLPESCQLVFDLFVDGEGLEAKYYFVDHRRRSIFFLDTFVVEPWIDTPGRLGHEIEGQYWYHLNVYPDSLKLPLSMVHELKDMTLHLIGDKMTANAGSNAPYSLEDLRGILDSTVIIEKSLTNHSSVGAMSFVSRIMYIYARSRFWDYSGEAHARIERGQSVYAATPKKRRMWIKKIVSYMLLRIPDSYLRSIEKLWVDQMVFHLDWSQLLKARIGEWNNYILIASIMLNVNIGLIIAQTFLPAQSGALESGAHLISSLSFLLNCSSILSGLFLVRQTPKDPTAEKLHAYLSHHENRYLGIDGLAVLHSLPYAFLAWGFILLLSAFYVSSFRLFGTASAVASVGFSVTLLALAMWVRSDWDDRQDPRRSETDAPIEVNRASSPDNICGSASALSAWKDHTLHRQRHTSWDSQHTAV